MGFVTDNIELLSDIAKCIAMQFGSNCEVVLHDLTLPYEHTIVAIWNGHVTGRKVGDGGTNAGLEILRGTASPKDQYHYINTTPAGRILRSSSKYFRDEYGKVNGSLCINYDITSLIQANQTLAELTNPNGMPASSSEFFTGSIDELLNLIINETIQIIGKTPESLTKEDKVAIVHLLDQKGVFLIKKSAQKVADFLNISRFTVYNYLNETTDSKKEN
jgi:predicted transcriptional regulator YheO